MLYNWVSTCVSVHPTPCHSVYVRAEENVKCKFQSWPPPCLGQDLYCSQLLHWACRLISIWGFSCLHIPSHLRSPGIADVHYWVWLYEDSGDLSSEVRSSFLHGKFIFLGQYKTCSFFFAVPRILYTDISTLPLNCIPFLACLSFFLGVGSHYVAQVGTELAIFLPQFPKY